MKKSIFTLAFLGFIFGGCSSKPLTITSVDYILEAEKNLKTNMGYRRVNTAERLMTAVFEY